MKKLNTAQTIALSIAGIGAATLIGVGGVQAAQDTAHTSLVDKIAARFNLNKADVQTLFDQDRSEMDAKHAQKIGDRLQKAVDAGTITSAQRDLIEAKQADMRTYMESLKDKTPDERHTAMKAKMEELKQWATDNGIPEKFVGPHGGRGGHGPGGPGGERPDGPPSSDISTQ